ncbi:helix-turn-helix domain-containing protein [Marinoscillum pacificum]|uniref:helix-turn-helix domain-containing protein n=1 Tax=Marinoscillum pacificum TaxID=392723 RepID=UPI00215863C6|nr:helix-turn-helix transcriptional regulator [Marinoscillum pacificum]
MAARLNQRDEDRLKPFRKKLRELREEQGLSQRELSTRCDVKHTKISQLEINEKSNLNLTTLFELARGLKVHPMELINYEFDFTI